MLVAGGVLQRAGYGGHVWVFAQWVRGLRALGHRVVFVDVAGDDVDADLRRADAAGVLDLLGGRDGIAVVGGEARYGLSREELLRVAGEADVLVNVMGYLQDHDVLSRPRRRLFVDIDPGFGQMWRALDLADIFDGHDAFVTVGTAIATSRIPHCGLDWRTTLPPVHLPDWPVTPPAAGAPITSVVSWRGPFGPIEFDGMTYGLRVHEFRRFVDLPRDVEAELAIALDIDPADGADRDALVEAGWTLLDPAVVAATPATYQSFVQGSRAELLIAKHLYVATRGGWFSDRSACYLASGRPVIAQDTGWTQMLPSSTGLLAFDDPASAAAALADIEHRYAEHCDAARAIAEEHFDAARVLPAVLEAAG